jgi:outer membrane protein OmpA-like peptidoglycan-associated protein
MNGHIKLTLLATALAAGCGTVSPVANQRLEEARASYQRAAADPLVQRHAQAELQRAAHTLAEAERAGSSELVEHNAYIAERSARTALSSAQARRAQVDLVAAHEERSRRLLQAERARAEQAEKARLEAEARASLLEEEKAKHAEFAAQIRGLESTGVRARQTERGWVLTANDDVLFESGTTLRPQAVRTLKGIARFVRKHPGRSIEVEGFTDSMGPQDANERLSERRAQAVKFALVQHGVEPYRIDARGMGANFPLASNESEAGRQQNRRVEVVIPE